MLASEYRLCRISIHAPPRGATCWTKRNDKDSPYFNSRPSARGDTIKSACLPVMDISIHAPPRGATTKQDSKPPALHFNSRPSARGDVRSLFSPQKNANFNSRPSARGDVRTWSNWDGTSISIHAPPRGATPSVGDTVSDAPIISIHAPPRGATSCRHATLYPSPTFQFTPLREGRLTPPLVRANDFHFNSRPSARGDDVPRLARTAMTNFNSRPSARGDRPRLLSCAPAPHFNSRPSARGD